MPDEHAHKAIYDEGMVVRRRVMGDEYVDNQLKKGVSEFMKPMQELTTEVDFLVNHCEQRSLINIALLAYQAKDVELAAHIRGAVVNGASEIEIRETLLHTAVYCGIPTGMQSFRVAEEALKKLKAEGLMK
ncbi:hypothetical protein E1B28_010122 [Marasmius oreades]|uniref:Carboxymuconolactone decarboxylase-like domain-containing protein n=1 Tax=Marasmius oreades TaxID=181124 RepID=A0A9P7RWN4_9AGAR|nr:uncharacterized protein E1B28_010122 [Marasmius oreades]KAG7091065.1 hypothetical protein E1B28_010122 [Marasmius oreades]